MKLENLKSEKFEKLSPNALKTLLGGRYQYSGDGQYIDKNGRNVPEREELILNDEGLWVKSGCVELQYPDGSWVMIDDYKWP